MNNAKALKLGQKFSEQKLYLEMSLKMTTYNLRIKGAYIGILH